MRYYSNSSAVVTTVRKIGHYPSTRTSNFLAKRFVFLFEMEEVSTRKEAAIAGMLRGDRSGWEQCCTSLTPSEFQILFDFGAWWAMEQAGEPVQIAELGDTLESDVNTHEASRNTDRAFIAVNLNRGRLLTILSR